MLPQVLKLLVRLSAAAMLASSFILQRPSQTVGASRPLLSASSVYDLPPVRSAPRSFTIANMSSVLPYNIAAAAPSAMCDGNKYGREVKSSSCIDALEIIPDLERTVSFGPRHQGTFMLGSCIFRSQGHCLD